MLGWDVGTFEFLSNRMTLKNYAHTAKIRMRTGGSTGKLPRSACKSDGNGGQYFEFSDAVTAPRLPVKYRYRSPVVFEFHVASKRGAAAYAVLWLQHLVDNEETQIDIPIWTTKHSNRLIQNYITEENCKSLNLDCLEDLTEVGRLQFTGRFSAGMDESHEKFVTDNNSRETFESWEACLAEGIRGRHVIAKTPENIQKLHEKSLVQGRDVLRDIDPTERQRWITKDGVDWSGSFGEDPKDSVDQQANESNSNFNNTSDNAVSTHDHAEDHDDDDEDYSSSDDEHSIHAHSTRTATTTTTTTTSSSGASSSKLGNKANKRTEQRQQRGLMQWKPARNALFAKHEAAFALRKAKKKFGMGDLTGREPDVETETGA
jgi:hypothetical protein